MGRIKLSINNSIYTSEEDFEFDEQLKRELRYGFVTTHKDYFEQISKSLKNKDFGTARRLTHTIKSSAGLIHEITLAKLSEDLESQIIKGESPDKEVLADFEIEFNRILSEIGEKERVSVSVDELLEKGESLQLLDAVEPLIKSQNGDSLNMLDSIRKIPGSEELCENLETYDFDAALSILVNLRETL